jgi:hypothetical protein
MELLLPFLNYDRKTRKCAPKNSLGQGAVWAEAQRNLTRDGVVQFSLSGIGTMLHWISKAPMKRSCFFLSIRRLTAKILKPGCEIDPARNLTWAGNFRQAIVAKEPQQGTTR